MSTLFASNLAVDWEINENGDIVAIEVWDITKLTRLAKPTSVDNIIRTLREEIRELGRGDSNRKQAVLDIIQACDDPAKLIKWIGQSIIDIRGQVDSTDTYFQSDDCQIMFR